jgi:MFS transporter, DHA1 family, multidrug resistance protein
MGVGYGAYAAAYVIGSSAAGFVMEAAGLRAPFLIYLGTTLAALGLLLATPGHRTRPDRDDAEPVSLPTPRTRRDGADQRQRLLAYGTGFVYVYALGTVLPFLPAYATDRGCTPRAVGLLLGAYWAGRVVASLIAGRISDRWGRRAVLVPALLGTALAGTFVAAPFGPVMLFLGTLGLGVAAGACAPTCVGLIADHVAPADRGIAMGLFESACGVAFILAGFLGGQIAYAIGPGVPYLLAGGLAVLWTPILAPRISPHPVGRTDA